MDELDQVLSGEVFKYSYRMSRLLRFVVEYTLEHPARPLQEHLLAVHVFDKPETFDPRTDPIVRVEASRLRAKLRDYYHGEGAAHAVHIHLPGRGYRPVFTQHRPKVENPTARAARPVRPAVADTAPSLLVLPFLDLSVERTEEYFCDGLAEELINLLARMKGIRVVARTSAFRFKNADLDIRELAERFQVSAILEGSVRREGDVVRVSVQLLNAADGYHLWSDTYQRPLRHLFSIQHEITTAIAEALKVKLVLRTDAEPFASGRRDDSPAYHLYLRGLHAWNRRTGEGFHQAIELLHQAADEDPDDARIQAKLAHCHVGLVLSTSSSAKETLGLAEACCHRALGLAPNLGEALAALAFVRAVRDWQWDDSESLFLRALAQAPGDPTIHEWYAAACLAPQGRYDSAIANLGQALDLDPVSVSVRCHLGLIFYLQGRYTEAARELKLALELEPGFYRGRFDLALALTMLHRFDEAIETFQAARAANPGSPFRMGALGYCYGRAGRRAEALTLCEELTRMPASAHVSAYCLAKLRLGLDDTAGALEMLRRALDERPDRLIWLNVDPVFEPLRAEPGFSAITRELGL